VTGRRVSRTRLFAALKALDVPAVGRLLDAQPDLLRAVDDRRRNALHFLCGLPADPKTAVRARALAGRLLDGGLDVNAPASWRAPSRRPRSGTRSRAAATCRWLAFS
jgi:hypothetical protein